MLHCDHISYFTENTSTTLEANISDVFTVIFICR